LPTTTLKSLRGFNKEEMISEMKNGLKHNYFKLKLKIKSLKKAHLF